MSPVQLEVTMRSLGCAYMISMGESDVAYSYLTIYKALQDFIWHKDSPDYFEN